MKDQVRFVRGGPERRVDPETLATPENRQIVQHLSARLDAVVAAWEARIAALRAPRGTASSDAPTAAPAALAALADELRRELDALDREAMRTAHEAQREATAASEWEQRAMLSVQEGRADMARQALGRHAEHREMAARLDAELAEIESLRAAYHEALAALARRSPDT